jgi:hypothetical protein
VHKPRGHHGEKGNIYAAEHFANDGGRVATEKEHNDYKHGKKAIKRGNHHGAHPRVSKKCHKFGARGKACAYDGTDYKEDDFDHGAVTERKFS